MIKRLWPRSNGQVNPPSIQPRGGRVRGGGDDTRTGSFPIVRRKPPRTFGSRASRIKALTSLLVAFLCALLGFGYVIQVHNTKSSYEGLSEEELVRLLDETSTQVDKLEERKSQLGEQLRSIQSSADKQQEAARIAKQNQVSSGILSGALPAQGKGVQITIVEGQDRVDAATMFTLLEELRNAGAEVIAINDTRVVTSTYLKDDNHGLVCDGRKLVSPYTIKAIGDPDALQNAVQIAGGVGSRIKVQFHAQVTVEQSNSVRIDEIRRPQRYQYAQTVE
ncbi:DUF881 domain-containing protein [Bifidobacterium xylocopae]|uniref:DUF881 domain-containing protein n=1 Tax=Bifidobacterium xylocopae TaxID=2493119 RepID=A0A366KD20_9BIFI|nr:DUF881 domain-containing protein [Bifidobacterium xylocopae]RBP99267.1 hypothetical protein CRD59_04365 [Bifidobacterium xylocopae]